MPERLLIAIGGSTKVLLDTLSPATRRAVAVDLESVRLAELALAVHGPTILGKVADTLRAEGLDPPGAGAAGRRGPSCSRQVSRSSSRPARGSSARAR